MRFGKHLFIRNFHVEHLEPRTMLAGDNPMACAAVQTLVLDDVNIISTEAVAQSGSVPGHCVVHGLIEDRIDFVLTLPDHEVWNEKMLQLGLGGFLGTLPASGRQRADLIRRGYAFGGSNLGHSSAAGEADWAWDLRSREFNENAQKDFGYYATHITTVVSRQITEAFYNALVSRSYFEGCSMGGRQGVVAAQRYPEDFDGVVAGSPGFRWTESMLTWIAIQQRMFPNPRDLSKPVLPKTKIPSLESAILAKCDVSDGLVDGLIADPRDCRFVPALDLPKCDVEDTNSCFTPDQIAVIETVFVGASNSDGQLAPGFSPGGYENYGGFTGGWKLWFIEDNLNTRPEYPNSTFSVATETLRYFVYGDPNYSLYDFDFENDVPDVQLATEIIDGTNTDLSPFKAAGGRLLIWHGWADYVFPPEGIINYYDDVVTTMGGKGEVDDFFRLFMLPSVVHCGGTGDGPSNVDWLTALEAWVEDDEAPEGVVATDGRALARSRPLCPYPEVAVWDGVGDSTTAEAFSCASSASARLPGDANLDGVFDSDDLMLALAAGKYETGESASWAEGDWDEDGDFDSDDLITALATGKYVTGEGALSGSLKI